MFTRSNSPQKFCCFFGHFWFRVKKNEQWFLYLLMQCMYVVFRHEACLNAYRFFFSSQKLAWLCLTERGWALKWTTNLIYFPRTRANVTTVVWEKKGTFICEIILERYIYLRNIQKQQKITNYVRNKSFFQFHPVYNGVCLKLLRSLL